MSATEEGAVPARSDEKPAAADIPLAMIRLIYESRDGRLCLFEDAEGHLTAVRTALLA